MGAWWLALIVGVAAGYSQIDITPLLTNERRTSGEVRIPEVRLTVDGKVGFPAQSVPMVVSTALPRSYVSTSLTSAVPSFAPARSLTLETNNTDIAFLSPSGFANGKLAYDTVQIGWLEADRHPFVMATGLDQSAISLSRSSSIGLGRAWSVLRPTYQFHLFFSVDNGVFASTLSFGEDLQTDMTDRITAKVIAESGHWTLPLTGVRLGEEEVGIAGKTAVINTAETYIVVPKPDFEALLGAVGGAKDCKTEGNHAVCRCGEQTGPELTIRLGEAVVSLKETEYFLELEPTVCLFVVENGGFVPGWTLGLAFISLYSPLFDPVALSVSFHKPVVPALFLSLVLPHSSIGTWVAVGAGVVLAVLAAAWVGTRNGWGWRKVREMEEKEEPLLRKPLEGQV